MQWNNITDPYEDHGEEAIEKVNFNGENWDVCDVKDVQDTIRKQLYENSEAYGSLPTQRGKIIEKNRIEIIDNLGFERVNLADVYLKTTGKKHAKVYRAKYGYSITYSQSFIFWAVHPKMLLCSADRLTKRIPESVAARALRASHLGLFARHTDGVSVLAFAPESMFNGEKECMLAKNFKPLILMAVTNPDGTFEDWNNFNLYWNIE